MKALRIDVTNQKVYQIELAEGIQAIYKELGIDTFCCPVYFDNEDCIYADDEALFKEVQGGFFMKGWAYPLINNCLVIGTDDEGGSVDCLTTAEELQNRITFLTAEQIYSKQF